ncbi:thioesterase family protein [Bauldia sp.]|uniref:thioesterase family protein n=1 Tax=Bauldia sp. TaxID=2575872 RepID=UPI003BAA6023
MSWLWGLGFFFSIHFAHAYGWIGLLAFAIPNALGLLFFGAGAAWIGRHHDLRNWAEERIARAPLVFALYQLVAVSLTIFAFLRYLIAEIGLGSTVVWGAILLNAAVLSAELLGFRRIVRLHAIYYAVAIGLGAALLAGTPVPELLPDRQPYDLTFVGFIVPLIAGLLFGPWLDLQQWQRAIAIKEGGISVQRGFAAGASLFFVILTLVGALSVVLVPDGVVPTISAVDGHSHGEGLVTATLADLALPLPILLFTILASIAMISTLDSAHLALRWYFSHLNRTFQHPLAAMVPKSLRTSTLPIFRLALLIAWAGLSLGAELDHFMIFFATFFLISALVLVLTSFWPEPKPLASSVIFLTGAISMAMMMIGYFEHMPVAMIGAVGLPPMLVVAAWSRDPTMEGAMEALHTDVRPEPGPEPKGVSLVPGETSALPEGSGLTHEATGGWFDGRWFTVPLIPTYVDTNSVGNVYFANYVAWVGKARELFFRHCMPDFDLNRTEFYILTRSVSHKFVREIKEFEAITVRLRIGGYNRKFVTLEHEMIRRSDGALIGSGSQSLMFVNANDYGLVDIPPPVTAAFIQHAPLPAQ